MDDVEVEGEAGLGWSKIEHDLVIFSAIPDIFNEQLYREDRGERTDNSLRKEP